LPLKRRTAKIVEDEAAVAARLGLPATSRLVNIERLRQTDEDAFALETCYLAASDFASLVNFPLGRVSLFGTLEHDFGVELAYADEEVDDTAAEAMWPNCLAFRVELRCCAFAR
jgi:DNA-binding GntR family transcriptional regulator